MSVYASYSDETELSNGQFVIGGYVANELEWPNFFKAWDELVVNSHSPIPYLHMVDIRSRAWREKDGHGISREQADGKVRKAVEVIAASDPLTGYISALSQIKHIEVSKRVEKDGYATFKQHHNYPDYFGFIAYLLAVLNDIPSHHPDVRKINFYVSKKKYVSHHLASVREAFARTLEEEKSPVVNLLGDVIPLSMEDHTPLQAADVLCWHIQREDLDDLEIRKNLEILQRKRLVGFSVPDSALDMLGEALMKAARNTVSDAGRFSDAVSEILKAPHSEIKLKLADEKAAKKRKKPKKSSASREGA